ncbi:hypothetical protein [uncultured Paracoccus sp.]|uniref:hypothetical protein n=1 Tax=uncultured Paracoccus sp. TaxID=189685 RepID=UPI0025D42E58|nr:hypothetical protein [uncultured Paracoccus sp.]
MAKAIFNRRFDATDNRKGVSIRVEPSDSPQTLPEWVIALAVKAGAASRLNKIPASAGLTEKEQ